MPADVEKLAGGLPDRREPEKILADLGAVRRRRVVQPEPVPPVSAPARVLVDTNVAIYLARGRRLAQAYRPHLEGRIPAVSFPTELFLTSHRARDPQAVLAYWRSRLPRFLVLFSDLETGEIWATTAAECSRRGRPRQDRDLWIAATALRWACPWGATTGGTSRTSPGCPS